MCLHCTLTVSALCSSQVTTEEGERRGRAQDQRCTGVQGGQRGEGEGRRPPTSHQDKVITHTMDPVTLWGWEAREVVRRKCLILVPRWPGGGAGIQLVSSSESTNLITVVLQSDWTVHTLQAPLQPL